MGGRGAKSGASGGKKVGDDYVKNMQDEQDNRAKGLERERAEIEAAAARIKAERNVFDPNRDIMDDNYDENGRLNDFYMESYFSYRTSETDKMMDKINTLSKGGQLATFQIKALDYINATNKFRLVEQKIEVKRLNRDMGGGIQIKINGNIIGNYGLYETGRIRFALGELY